MIEIQGPVKESALLESFEGGRLVALTPRGGSMKPLIRDGERIFVSRNGGLKTGDVVLAAVSSGLVAHRVVGIGNGRLLLKGDAVPGAPESVAQKNVFGRVDAVEKNGCLFDLRGRRGRSLSQRLWKLSRISAPVSGEALMLVPRRFRERLRRLFFTGIYQVPYAFFNWWAHAGNRAVPPLRAEYEIVKAACMGLVCRGRGLGMNVRLLKHLDWELIFDALKMHQFTPAFYQSARMGGWLEHIPRKSAARLGAEYRTNLARNMVLIDETKKLLRALPDAGITVVPIQGAAMLAKLYADDPGIRPLGDVDLLVRWRDLDAARNVLARMGFRELGGVAARNAEAFETGIVFRRQCGLPGVPVLDVELHYWEPLERTFMGRLFSFDTDGVWERMGSGVFDGMDAPVLDPVDELVFHIIHTVASHHVGRLIWYLDMARHVERFGGFFPWDEFRRRSGWMRIGRVTALAFAVQREYFGSAPLVGTALPSDRVGDAWLRTFSSPSVFLSSKFSDRRKGTSFQRFIAKALLLLALADGPRARVRVYESIRSGRAVEKEYFYGRLGGVLKTAACALHRPLSAAAWRILMRVYSRGPSGR